MSGSALSSATRLDTGLMRLARMMFPGNWSRTKPPATSSTRFWEAGSDSEVTYSPCGFRRPVSRSCQRQQTRSLPLDSLAECGLDAGQIERAFLRWLESRAGQPVSFTSDLAVWPHQDATALTLELVERAAAQPE